MQSYAHIDGCCALQLRPIIARALNKNQILILNAVNSNTEYRIYSTTALLNKLSSERGVPTSTLRLNTSILEELGLIEKKSAMLTEIGRLILSIMM